jgi:hypothetical protein
MPFFQKARSLLTSNPLNNVPATPQSGLPVTQAASDPIGLNPLFGRPNWTYVTTVPTPVTGPSPRLAVGTGRTGDPALPGNSAQLPGYLSDQQYFPSVGEYAPVYQERFTLPIPKQVGNGENGRQMVSTYEPHAFTPGTRMFNQYRSATNWQEQAFPPSGRELLSYQMVQKYQVQNSIARARPLAQNNYFLGYQLDPSIAGEIGNGSGNGSLGG